MKKFLSALMAIVLAISTALAASAAFDSRTAENSTVEIPTLYFDSAEAYERHAQRPELLDELAVVHIVKESFDVDLQNIV